MSVTTGNQAQVMLDGFNLHQFAKSFGVNPDTDMHDASVLGTTSRIKLPGLKHATASSEAFHDDTAVLGSYNILKGKYGAAVPGIFSYAHLGFGLGNPVILMYANEVSLQSQSIVADLNMLTLNAEAAEDAVDFGVSLHVLSAETSLPVTGASVDNAAATANGGVGVLHVTAMVGAGDPNIVYTIQHSVDNSVWVDLVNFVAVTAVSSQRIEVAAGTTIRRYLRNTITEGGATASVTGVVSFARR